jgi:hypothetical protein
MPVLTGEVPKVPARARRPRFRHSGDVCEKAGVIVSAEGGGIVVCREFRELFGHELPDRRGQARGGAHRIAQHCEREGTGRNTSVSATG